jgi:hypothetical protein
MSLNQQKTAPIEGSQKTDGLDYSNRTETTQNACCCSSTLELLEEVPSVEEALMTILNNDSETAIISSTETKY